MAAAAQFLQFTYEQKSAAQELDPSLEALLREVIVAFRVQEITDRGLFVALGTSEECLRKTAEESFGVDTTKGFIHKRELAKIVKAWETSKVQNETKVRIVKAWETAKVQNETKVRVDAVARAHGEPVTMLHPDWVSLMTKFKRQYGQHWHDDSLPSQSFRREARRRLFASGVSGSRRQRGRTDRTGSKEARARAPTWIASRRSLNDPDKKAIHVQYASDH